MSDFVDLLLELSKKTTNIIDTRADELIHLLYDVVETFTLAETSTVVTAYPHPVKYDEAHAIYDRCTYGMLYYRMKLTIDQTKIDSDLTDFPVLVTLTNANFDFSKCKNNGYNIQFRASDGSTVLKYERERHDKANELAEYWVKIPSISSTVDTDFYMYYGLEAATDGADPENVWDNNFVMVQHMNDTTTSTITDSTQYDNDGVKKGANEPIEATGQIGKAQSFDGTDDYINCNNDATTNVGAGNFTASCWLKVTTASSTNYYFGRSDTTDGWLLYLPNTDSAGVEIREVDTANTSQLIYYNITQSFLDNWNHVTVIKTGSSFALFQNGIELADSPKVGYSNVSNAGVSLEIGRLSWWAPGCMKGLIDSIRLSNIARSAAWIKAEYNSGANTLLTFGTEELLYA